MRFFRLCVSAVCCAAFAFPASQALAASAPGLGPREAVARVHWLGKKRLGAEPVSAYVMEIWRLPASVRLEAQTVTKLGDAVVRSAREAMTPQMAARVHSLFKPLAEDLIEQESYFDVWQSGVQAHEFGLAIQLDTRRVALWETNITAILEVLANSHPNRDQNGLQFTISGSKALSSGGPSAPRQLWISHSGEWTLLGLGTSPGAAIDQVKAQIQRSGVRSGPPATNFWVTAELDLARLAHGIGAGPELAAHFGRLSFRVTGTGGSVVTRGEIDYASPLSVELRPWNVPTNLVREPLIAFTAARGFSSTLASSEAWKRTGIGRPPDEGFCWAQGQSPLQNYFALPMPNASAWVARASEYIMSRINPLVEKQKWGRFLSATNGNGIVWYGMPFMAPFLQARKLSGGDFAVGGMLSVMTTNHPAPQALYQAFLSRPNVVCYDWEITEESVRDWLYNGQLMRLMFGKAQMTEDSSGLTWLTTIAPKLGNCVTVVTKTSPTQLSFVRQSSIGLKGAELHLLADWLESPRFPFGLHTLLATNTPPGAVRHTNAPPARPRPGARTPPPRRAPLPPAGPRIK